jgi:hypothetical protein
MNEFVLEDFFVKKCLLKSNLFWSQLMLAFPFFAMMCFFANFYLFADCFGQVWTLLGFCGVEIVYINEETRNKLMVYVFDFFGKFRDKCDGACK